MAKKVAEKTGIVAATGVAVRNREHTLGKTLEGAMQDAILKASEDGITDPVKIRKRMAEAREAAGLKYRTEQEQAANNKPADASQYSTRVMRAKKKTKG